MKCTLPDDKDVVYVSGPMSNIKDLNFPMFNRVTAALRARGYTVLNPVETNSDVTTTWLQCIAKDLISFEEHNVTAICLLPRWRKSFGARIEVVAGEKGKYKICRVQDLLPRREWKGPNLYERTAAGIANWVWGAVTEPNHD